MIIDLRPWVFLGNIGLGRTGMAQLEMKWTEFTLTSFLVAFLSLFIISDTCSEKNHVVRNGNFGLL